MQTMLDGGWTPLKPVVGELHDGQQHRTFYASPSATAAARRRVAVRTLERGSEAEEGSYAYLPLQLCAAARCDEDDRREGYRPVDAR